MGVNGGLVDRDTEKKARVISLELVLVFALAVCGLVGVGYIGLQMTTDRTTEARGLEDQLDTLAGPNF